MEISKTRARRGGLAAAAILLALLLALGAADYILGGMWQEPFVSVSGFVAGDDSRLARINSPYLVLVSLEDGQVLLQRRADEKIYPASMSKIMTALVALENIEDMEERIVVPADVLRQVADQSASTAGFRAGEDVRAIDLIYGALLPSGADACMTLATHIAGSEEAFADMMNAKAREIGLEDTRFANSCGLHSSNNYSTVGDIALLFAHALESDIFRDAVTRVRYSTAGTMINPDGITVRSTLFASMAGQGIECDYILGGKTGYTKEAGQCLVSLGQVDGRQYVLVTAGAPGNGKSKPYHILDAVEVYGMVAQAQEAGARKG